jgi:two-component system cell cycle response regulator
MFTAAPHPDRLAMLSEISRSVSATLDLQALYDTIYREISRVMDTTLFSLALYDGEHASILLPYIREEGKLFVDQRVPFGNNVTSLVIQRGLPLLFHSHAEYRQFAADNGLPPLNVGEDVGEAVMFVPLHTGSRTIGCLSVESKHPNAYTQDDLETLTIIAPQAAVAVENARLYARSQDSFRQMRVLLRVAQTINQSLSLRDVLDAILLSIREVMPYAFSALLLPDYVARTLDIVGSIGPENGHDPRAGLVSLKIPFYEGISGQVFRTGEPMVVDDVRTFPGFVDHELNDVLSEIAVPLRRGDSVVGVLDVGREGVGAFVPEDVHLLSLFASQAAIAIENARLFDEQRQRVKELQMLEAIVRQLTPLLDPVEIAALMKEEVRHLIDFHACQLYLLDADGETLIAVGAESDPGASIHSGFAGWIVRQGRADVIANTLDDPRPQHILGTPQQPESMIGAPLIYEGRVQGAITLSRLGIDRFDDNARRLLEIVAAQVAIACDRARLYGELRTEALTDPLVRLWNRRYLMDRYRAERSRAVRHERPLVALMLDIDTFKRVNDTYGHDAGDVVLQEIAALIRAHTRTEDIVARYGGEEFCVLLPETSLDESIGLAQRLRESIAAHSMPEAAGVKHVTVSVGAAVWSPLDGGEELFSRADQAMYRVKAGGGNAVCIAESGAFRPVE